MRSVPIARARPSCHVNIGRHPSSLSLLLCPPSLRRARLAKRTVTVNTAQQGSSRSSRDSPSPTSSVSDAIVSFFDDITRGSVSIDEDDIIPDDVTRAITAAKDDVTREVAAAAAAATAAADAAAATAGAAARAAAGAEDLSAAGREWEGAAMTALTAAVAAAGEGISSRDGSSSSSGKAGTVRALETFAAVAQQDLAVGGTGLGSSSGGSGGGSSSSSSDASKVQPKAVGSGPSGGSSSSSSSKQVVTEEAVKGAGGELQAAALSLTDASEKLSVGQVVVWLFKGVIGVGLLQAFKSGVEAAMQKVGISSIPPAVASMLAVPVLLAILRPSIADRVVQFYDSCIAPWTTDFLGLFYVPAVAILPVLLRGMQGSDLTGLLTVSALSTAATLLLTATAATNWTKQQPTPPPPAASSSSSSSNGFRLVSGPAAPVLLSFAFLAAAGPLAATRFDPLRFGPAMAFPVGFAWSLLGYVAAQVYLQQQQQDDPENGGKAMPAWLSPVLAGAVAANIGVAWHGSIMGWGYLGALSRYYTGEVFGAGDLLIAPLGAALTALGVLIYKHRRELALPAIAATATLSAAFSVATSAAAAKLLGVSTDWARAFIPRSVTGSTASHFAQSIGAPAQCTGLVVLLQAAFTIALGASILKVVRKGGKLNAAAAGTAVGVTAGAMGVAGVAGSDEVALANGAMAYAFMVVVGSLLSGIPSIASALATLVA